MKNLSTTMDESSKDGTIKRIVDHTVKPDETLPAVDDPNKMMRNNQ
ncbi:MAG: hypothetical protein IPN86_15425 [Saprospiraceae bacterium]|nr:hypothetical protein [Saprospiraceae bacterium]